MTRTAVIFIISDFIDTGFEKPLKILSRKHDVIAIHLQDRRELNIPSIGLVEIQDLETGNTRLVDASSSRFRDHYEKSARERKNNLDKLFKVLGIDKIDVQAEGSYVEPLMKFFKIREKLH